MQGSTMMLRHAKLLSLLVFTLACGFRASRGFSDDGNTADQTRHVRVLAVGNSFTVNATRYLQELTDAAGHRLTLKLLSIGGSPLERHAGMALAFEKDHTDPTTLYSRGESLQQALQSEDWDFVTIQQASIKSHDVETYRPYAEQLADIVHRYAPRAELLVHQTWAYRSDDPRFRQTPDALVANEPATQRAMYEGLAAAYRTICSELSVRRIPVGDAFWIADNDPQFGFQADEAFDVSQAAHPQLPSEKYSLHRGYRWTERDGSRELGLDGHHANAAGEYLGGCVWFECLFGESAIGIPFIPENLDATHATFLQQVAAQAVRQGNDVARGVAAHGSQAILDPTPQRYTFQARASEIDPRTKEYPEIEFLFGTDTKPADLEYASVDTRAAPQGKLAIWLMGNNPELFDRLNRYGIHAIGVSYARGWFGKLCRPAPKDAYARGRIRLEAATGLDFSDELNLLPPDGAAERARQLVIWLCKQNPQGNWDQFLSADQSRIRWDKVILTGASHGSTTAARFAQYQRVDRVVMLCGPRDQDQDWQALPSATPANRYFGFSHVLDGGWTGDHYCRSWELLGMNSFGPIVDIDREQPPYGNSRRLISAADVGGDAGRAHSSVTPGRSSPENPQGQKLFEPVWRYLYTHPVERVGEPSPEDPDCQRIHAQYE